MCIFCMQVYCNWGSLERDPPYDLTISEMVPWCMCETDVIRNGGDRHMCHPL